MPRNSVAYDDDFFAWTQEQARLLRGGDLSVVDAENLAEEIESMGRRDRRELRSRLVVLIAHLLKWKCQARRRSQSWQSTIRTQRREIELVLGDSPSLRPLFDGLVAEEYGAARQNAADETRSALRNFPAECPFTPEQILSEDFLPE